MSTKYAVISYTVNAPTAPSVVPVGVAVWSPTQKSYALRVIDRDEILQGFDSRTLLRFVRHASAQIERWSDTGDVPYPSAREEHPWEDEWWAHIRDLFVHELRLSTPMSSNSDMAPKKAVDSIYEKVIAPHRVLQWVGQPIGELPVRLTMSRVIQRLDVDLITEYRSANNDPYFRIWSQSVGNVTRWLYLRLTDSDIARFMHRDRTVRDLICGARDGHIYVVDTVESDTRRVAYLRSADIPAEMLPKYSYYDSASTPPNTSNCAIGEQLILLDGQWDGHALGKFERRYTQVYTFNVLFARGSNRDIERVRDGLVDHVFAGSGWRHVNAVDRLVAVVPREDKPTFKAIQLQSPGVVSYVVETAPASRVRDAMALLRQSGKELRKSYAVLHEQLIENNRAARVIEAESGYDAMVEFLSTPNEHIRRSAVSLAERLGLDVGRIWAVAGADINSAELVANYFRKIEELYANETDGYAVVV